MEFTGRYHIAATPQIVWQGLKNPALLQKCVPGCKRMEQCDPAHFAAAVTVRVGPLTATFENHVTITERTEPSRFALTVQACNDGAGSAQTQAIVFLSPKNGGTELSYLARAEMEGKLAQVGQRLVDGAVRKTADQFFARFAIAVAPKAGAPTRPDTVSQVIWLAGLGAVAAILLLMFTVVM